MDKTSYFLRGVLPLFVASCSWGASYFIRKYVSHEIGIFTLVLIYSSAGAVFLYALSPSQYSGLFRRFIKNWKPLLLMSLLSVTLGGVLMNTGLQYIDLGIASLLERTQAIFTVVIAAIFLGERLGKVSIILGLIGIVAGIFLIPIDYNSLTLQNDWRTAVGVMCVMGAAFVWAISSVMGRKLSQMNLQARDMALIRAIIGVITALPLVMIFEPSSVNVLVLWKAVLFAALGGILASGIGYSLYYFGLQILSVGVASMIEILTPITAVILGILFLHEQMSFVQWVAAAILLASLTALVWIESKRHHELIEVESAASP